MRAGEQRRTLRAAIASAFGATALASGALILPQTASAIAVADPAATLKLLSPSDAQRYASAFAAMRRGDFIAGQNQEHGLADPCLVGRLEAVRLLHSAYHASYAELSGWLDHYADLPEAPRVYDLALRHKPRNAPAPRAPVVGPAGVDEAPSGAAHAELQPPTPSPAANGRQQAARAAFYAGDASRAYDLAAASGERWIGGLAAYRLHRYPDALRDLSTLAADPKQNPWVHSAADYWAARSAKATGDAGRAHELLKLAARAPDTFYGLIATRELDEQAARTPDASVMGGDPIGAVLAAAAVDPRAVADLARTDPRAHRAAALTQIGLGAEAAEELRIELAAASPADRPQVTSLALALNAPVGAAKADVAKTGWARFDTGHFPTPILLPDGGFIVDKALVYALVRQESRFDAGVVSGSGAYGLMQLTAATAARLAGDSRLLHDPRALRNPALNLKLGQAYVAKLLGLVQGDVLRAVASYNAGPGMISRLTAKMGQDVDSLMLMESMPSSQTRDYVQRVMAGYWTYRQIFGLDSKTLDAAASGTRVVASADF